MKYVQKWKRQILKIMCLIILSITTCVELSAQTDTLYISNFQSDTVSVIDTIDDSIVTTIPILAPMNILSNLTGSRIYVGCSHYGYDTQGIDVIDTNSKRVIATIPEISTSLFGMAISPINMSLYVTTFKDSSIKVIDTNTNNIIKTIYIEGYTGYIAVNSTGTRAYVSSYMPSYFYGIVVIDTVSNSVIATIPMKGTPSSDEYGLGISGIAVSPIGMRIYVSDSINGSLNVIDSASNEIIATLSMGYTPDKIVVNPTGTRVYVSGFYFGPSFEMKGVVNVIDTGSNSIVAVIPIENIPYSLAINPSGTLIYVVGHDSSYKDTVTSVIDAATNRVVSTMPSGKHPAYIAVIDSDQNLLNANSIKIIGEFTSTSTKFSGGVSKDKTNYQLYLAAVPSSTLTTKGRITVDPADIGKQADLFWVVGIENNPPFDGGVDTAYFVVDEMGSPSTVDLYNQPTVWMNQLAEKPFKRNVTLQKETVIDEMNLDYPNSYPSVNYYFMGYRLQDGTLVYSQTPIISKIE